MAENEAPSGGNVFTRKVGPLPMWGWMAIGLLLAVFYYLYKKQKGGTSGTAQAANSAPGGVDASLVPQFVNQTYTNVSPPAAPDVTVNNQVEPGGTPTPGAMSEILSKGHVISPKAGKATVGWSLANVGAKGATRLKVQLNGPGQPDIHPITRYVPATATTATFEGLLPNHNYQVWVTPVDASGKVVGQTGQIDLKTVK